MPRLRWIWIPAAALLAGCQPRTSETTVRRPQADALGLAGERAAPLLEQRNGGTVEDGAAEERMQIIGERLARHLLADRAPRHYLLLRTRELNAYSLPGRVYVTAGLYDAIRDDHVLAAVLGHELAHLEADDGLKPTCNDAGTTLRREIAADRRAVQLLRDAGYDVNAFHELLALIRDVQPAPWARDRTAAARAAIDDGE
jgi:predicted Zn-dependent protease